MASCPRLHPQRSFCRRAIHKCGDDRGRRAIQYCDNNLPQAELLYYAKKKIGIGRGSVAATTDVAEPFYFATKKIRIGRGIVEATTDAGGPFFFEATIN